MVTGSLVLYVALSIRETLRKDSACPLCVLRISSSILGMLAMCAVPTEKPVLFDLFRDIHHGDRGNTTRKNSCEVRIEVGANGGREHCQQVIRLPLFEVWL